MKVIPIKSNEKNTNYVFVPDYYVFTTISRTEGSADPFSIIYRDGDNRITFKFSMIDTRVFEIIILQKPEFAQFSMPNNLKFGSAGIWFEQPPDDIWKFEDSAALSFEDNDVFHFRLRTNSYDETGYIDGNLIWILDEVGLVGFIFLKNKGIIEFCRSLVRMPN